MTHRPTYHFGLIGQYAHGNEPAPRHIPVFHPPANPTRPPTACARLFADLYTDKPSGLSGQRGRRTDVGMVCALLLGFYQPALRRAVTGSDIPKWSRATLEVPGGQMVLEKQGEGYHIASVSLNGKKLTVTTSHNEELIAEVT